MNIDKLKALAEQTELLQERNGQKYIDNMDGLEQFADLIVRDVAGIYFQHAVQGITREQDVALAVVIKNHFGVK
jgi:hypothetical protein